MERQRQGDAARPGSAPAANATGATSAGASAKTCPTCGGVYGPELRFCPSDGSSLRMPERVADLVGQTIGDKYHVLAKLGEGGMGQVFLAEHVKLRQRRAVKVMHRSLINDEEAVHRFTGEALKAGQVYHQNVAAVVDCGETADGMAYLVMEYVAGESFTKLLERERALAPARVADIIGQVAEGLSAAHDLGIVHRDMKPDNIMVCAQRDGREVVKVVDFGIAKATQEATTQMTRPGFVIGTPEYMSPEQASAGKLDQRSDIYALALVAFRALTGKLPFRGSTPHEVMFARLSQQPATLAEVRADLAWPAALQGVFDRALARDAAERYATAREFSDALRSAITGAGDQRSPAPPRPARGDVTTVSHRRLALAAGGALVAALLAAALYQRGRESDPALLLAGPLQSDTLGASVGARVDERRTTRPAARDTTQVTPRVRAGRNRQPVVASPVRARDSAAAPVVDTAPVVAPPPRRFDARAALDSLRALTDPLTATEASARRALDAEAAILPRLTNGTDSVEAGMRRLEAYLHLDDQRHACALLDQLATQALGTRLERAVAAYREAPTLRCGGGY